MRNGFKVALLGALLTSIIAMILAVQPTSCDFIKPARIVVRTEQKRTSPSTSMSSGGKAVITAGDDVVPNGGCARRYQISDVTDHRVWLVKWIPDCRHATQVMHSNNLLFALLFPVSLTDTKLLKDPELTRKKFGPKGVAGMRVHPITGQYKMHKGLDSGEVSGTPILASATGRVTEKYRQLAGGNILSISSVMGEWCVKISYLHLSRYEDRFSRGSSVSRGDLVAYSGNTGTSTTGAHLHFETRITAASSRCMKLEEELTETDRKESKRAPIVIPSGCSALDDAGMVDPFCFPWDFLIVRSFGPGSLH